MTRTERECRSFACWAARRAWALARCRPSAGVVAAVERHLAGEIGIDDVRKAREAGTGGVQGALACGISRGLPQAAVQIAAWHAAHDSAESAAQNVIHHAALAAGLRAMRRAGTPTEASTGERPGVGLQTAFVGELRALVPANTAAMLIEKAFLEGELRRRLSRARPSAVKRS